MSNIDRDPNLRGQPAEAIAEARSVMSRLRHGTPPRRTSDGVVADQWEAQRRAGTFRENAQPKIETTTVITPDGERVEARVKGLVEIRTFGGPHTLIVLEDPSLAKRILSRPAQEV